MRAIIVLTKKGTWYRKQQVEIFPLENFRISSNGILIIGQDQYNNKKAFSEGSWVTVTDEDI